jgi:hypothetical protein
VKKGWLGIVLSAAAVLLFGGPALADLIYNETLTIALDDGTIVNLILSDSGGLAQPPEAPLQKLDMGYLNQAQRLDSAQLAQKYVDHSQNKYFWPSSKNVTQKVYYYLPPPPHISVDEQGRPEFLFIKFVSDKAEAEGGVSGGILHFLAQYGLTAEQERELAQKLGQKIQGATLAGAVPMESGGGETTFRVISATLASDDFTKKIIASGRAPLMPGLKVACAARLTSYGATLLEETLKKPTGDLSIEFYFTYTAHAPAFKGRITYNWSKFKQNSEDYSLKYEHAYKRPWYWPWSKTNNRYRTEEIQQIYDFMCQHELINIEVSEGLVDERVEAIRQLFMDTMTNFFFERSIVSADEDEEDEFKPTESELKPTPKGRQYEFTRFRSKTESAFIDRDFTISWKLSVKVEYTTTGKVSGAWYLDSKDKFPELFDEINLDDPFFQRRTILFNLDLDAADIFADAINYVTIEVRKKRTTGRDFTSSITIDQDYLKKKGVSAQISYAKMREDDPNEFEYMVRWSMRGGFDFPQNPRWETGNWQGVTLAPPIRPLEVVAETDLEELRQNDVVRATVQLRYYKFGSVFNDTRSLQLSVAANEALKSMKIFQDADRRDFEYQVTYYHKTKGRVQERWQKGFLDGYIYCVLPDELRKEESQ